MNLDIVRFGGVITRLLILIGILLTSLIPIQFNVSAQGNSAPARVVRSLYTSEYGVRDPKGLAFSPNANSFLILGSPDTAIVTMGEDNAGTLALPDAQSDPLNAAFDKKSESLFVLNRGKSELVKIQTNVRGLPNESALPIRYTSNAYGLKDPQGITFDPSTGRLVILDAGNSQIVSVVPHPTLGFDANEAIRSNKVQKISLKKLGLGILKGLAYNPTNGHFYITEPAQKKLHELTQDGNIVSTYDLAALGINNPSAMTFAPSGDTTDDLNIYDLFILDEKQTARTSLFSFTSTRQQTTSSGSQIVELSLMTPTTLPPGTTLQPSTLVNMIDTSNAAWSPSSPDPSGIDYVSSTGHLLISDSEVEEMPNYFVGKNVYESTTSGTLLSTCDTLAFSSEPSGLTINSNNNHIFFSDDDGSNDQVVEVSLGADGVYCTSDDVATSTNVGGLYGATDAEDVAWGNNTLFISDGINAEVVMIPLGPNGVLGGGDDGAMTHFDTAALGFNDLEGIDYNSDAGTLFIVSTQGTENYLGEVTTSGTLINAYDLSFMGTTGNLRSDVAYAPGSQTPLVKNLYIVSRGIDNNNDPNENDGKVWEVNIYGTNTPAPSATLTRTSTPTSTPTPLPSSNPFYGSFANDGSVGGVAFADEDILQFNGTTWGLFFDGSDVGLSAVDTFAFYLLDPDSLLLAFNTSVTLGGTSYAATDIVRFDATSLGATTAGSFSMYFNGADVGLSGSTETIDALEVLPDNRVLISTTGDPVVTGVTGADEDILAFTPTTLGTSTSGTWSMYFDGSDVGLADTNNEDIDAVDVAANGNIFLSTIGAFSVPGVSGDNEDVFVCTSPTVGSNTACTYSSVLYFDGSTWGQSGNDVDAFNLIGSGAIPTATPSNTPTHTPTRTPTATTTSTPSITPTVGPSFTPTASPTPAVVITVNTTTDENVNNASCSLREAIIAANNNAAQNGCPAGSGNDVIVLTGGLTYTLSLVGTTNTTGDLDIGSTTSGNLTIQSSGTNAIIDANDIDRVIDVASGGDTSLTLIGITVTNGNNTGQTTTTGGGIRFAGNGTLSVINSTVSSNVAANAAGCGGGIFSNTSATVYITNSTIADNSCPVVGSDGGGLFKGTGGVLNITNSTFNNNSTDDNGGGVQISAGTATIINSTFANNTTNNRGGGIQVGGGTVTIEFSTFSDNTANGVGGNAGGAIQASGGSASIIRSILANSPVGLDCDQSTTGTITLTNSLVESNVDCTGTFIIGDPSLGALADNGGPTKTMAINNTSLAFDVATSCGGITGDQRGITRPQGPNCDLGAFEYEYVPPTATSTFTPTLSPTPSFTFTPTFTRTSTPTPTPTLVPSSNPFYGSFANDGSVGGVAFADEDILQFSGTTWSLFFDGSDVGLGGVDTFAFYLLDPDSLLLAFDKSVTLGGVSYATSDIVRFDATSLGATTAGSFSMYFNGADVGLSSNFEDIDAIEVLSNNQVLISTTGDASVTGVTGADEDVLAFTPTTLGTSTSGTWSLYFDGSDVGLADTNNEDIDALDVASNGNIFLSTIGLFSVPGVSGDNEDVFICTSPTVGNNTACTYSSVLYFDGSTWGQSGNDVDAFNLIGSGIIPTATPSLTPTATNTSAPTNTFTPTHTPTNTFTPTNTLAPTDTATQTSTFTPTHTLTSTFTPTETPTETATSTPSSTPTASPTPGAAITVNTITDEFTSTGDLCSLREAIDLANSNAASANDCTRSGVGIDDVIVLNGGLTYTLSLVGTTNATGDLDIGSLTSGNLTIQSSGTNAIIDANDIDRVIDVAATGDTSLTLIGITIQNGDTTAQSSTTGGGIRFGGNGTLTLINSKILNNVATNSAGCGAGIHNNSSATINIMDSMIEDNSCPTAGADGAGLFKGTGGTLTITNSTFDNNIAADNGGGINIAAGTATIRNSTFANNTAGNRGGGLQIGGGTVTIEFSTFSGNTANGALNNAGAIQASSGSATVTRSILANSPTGMDCNQSTGGTIALTNSLLENNNNCTGTFIAGDPGLGTLADNGGPTWTMAISNSSLAFDAATSCGTTTSDQRGITRPQFSSCDLGAFELEPVLPTNTPTDTLTPTHTFTPTDTPTITLTPTHTSSPTQTLVPTSTFTSTHTLTPTDTLTPTNTFTPTDTPTDTLTPTSTPIPTETPTLEPSSTPTNTPPATATFTPTSVPTPSNTPTPTNVPDLIFADGFELGSFSSWTSNTNDLGDLSVSGAAALVGSQGMQAVIDDLNTIYVTDDNPNAETRYRARFYFDPNSITMASGDAHFIFKGFMGTATDVLQVEFRNSSGAYQIRAKVLNDSSAFVVTNWFNISDAPHVVEVDWRAATAVGANNGGLTFWIDGVQQADLTGVDNDTGRIDRARLGALAGIDAGTTGTYYFDAFESRRQTYIGP